MSNDEVSPTINFRGPSRVIELSHADLEEANEGVPWFDGSVDTWDEPKGGPPPIPGSSPPPSPPNTRLRDEGEIARGGMGSIRRLYDSELRRHVAMKVLTEELAGGRDAKQRFLDEARITGQLDHPNVVPVHDLVLDDRGTPSYTMKLVDGETLTKLIAAQKSRRDLEKLLEILIKVCDALSFAHSRGIIHRDLKPDNVMVGSFGQVYVMDWGCAHVVGEDRSVVGGRIDPEGTVIGTVQYMAPEQAWGQIAKIDQRTDVFAIGGLLYKMLTGAPPWPGPFERALIMAQMGEIRPPDESTGVAVRPPPDLSRIAMKAMARLPEERYQTAQQVADELRAFLRGGNWFPLHKFPAGAVIVREGDRPEAAYIITAGHCEVRKRESSDPSRSVTLRTLKPGDVFGETAIFADAPRSASVVALDEVSAVVVGRAALDDLLRSSWLGLFVKALADRFLDLDARLSKAR
jgi:serine/threonine-protein kinase